MATQSSPAASGDRKLMVLTSLGLSLLAMLVYGLSLSRGAFPGESAQLMAAYSGLEPLDAPVHPVFGMIVAWLSGLHYFSLPIRLNLFSAICSVVSVILLFRIVVYFIRDVISEDYSVDFSPRVSYLAGVVAAIVFLFSVPVWQAAIRLQYQSFDLLWALFAFYLLIQFAIHKKGVLLFLFAIVVGAGVVETSLFIALTPLFGSFLIYVLWRTNALSLPRLTGMLIVSGAMLSLYYVFARRFFLTTDCAAMNMHSVLDVVVQMWRQQGRQLQSGLPRVGWLILLMMSVVPFVTAMLASFRALNNERTWSQYILHFVLSVMVIVGLTNETVSPWGILKPLGRLPVGSSAMLAMVAGYLFAYWYLLMKVKRPRKGSEALVKTHQVGDWMGLIMTYPFAVILAMASLLNIFECRGSRGDYADRCAKEILDRMGSRTWLVTDGTLDPHLQILAKERGRELNLLCLQKDMSPFYLKSLAKLVAEKKLFDEQVSQRMKSTLELGVLPFIQDWFSMDKEIEKKVAVFAVPDFWYTAGITPIPEYFFFSGCRDIKVFEGRPILGDYKKFWSEMDAVLAVDGRRFDLSDPINAMKKQLRRHMGFVANNLGVLLEDIGQDKEAFEVYTYVSRTIDPENISSLFNRFEMARRGSVAARAHKEQVERELKEFIANLKQQYPLWSLSRYYGYVRSPELFARLGWGWALSGQTGAALAGVNRAINLLPSDRQNEALQAMAAIYALSDDRNKTEAVYQDILKSDASNRSAMLGLARLSIQEGALDKAKNWLEKATRTEDKRGVLGVEWATIHLMNNDIPRARLALQETTDLQPKNLQAWAMLAMLQLQQDEKEDVEKVILPRMENIAGTLDNYFIQISRAQLALKKGKGFQRAAREGFIRASILRPDIPAVKDMILQLDIAMNDQQAAELHARQVLRSSRKHALANYVMGSLRLQEGSYGEAEDFLRRSVESSPSAAALNDLAEVLRRIKKLPEAERFAREAVKKNPDLYVAWETLGSILLDANRNLDEAESAIKKSLALFSEDMRINITLARIQLRRGDIERACETIRKIKVRQSELSKFEQTEFSKLSDEAAAFRRP